jgi:hypothetical protein
LFPGDVESYNFNNTIARMRGCSRPTGAQIMNPRLLLVVAAAACCYTYLIEVITLIVVHATNSGLLDAAAAAVLVQQAAMLAAGIARGRLVLPPEPRRFPSVHWLGPGLGLGRAGRPVDTAAEAPVGGVGAVLRPSARRYRPHVHRILQARWRGMGGNHRMGRRHDHEGCVQRCPPGARHRQGSAPALPPLICNGAPLLSCKRRPLCTGWMRQLFGCFATHMESFGRRRTPLRATQ